MKKVLHDFGGGYQFVVEFACQAAHIKLITYLLLFSCPLGSLVSLWNFETIRGSLMKPKWQTLASLAQEICTL